MARTKINFYIDDEVLAKVDDYAKQLGIKRGSAFSVICTQFFEDQEFKKASQAMAKFMESEVGRAVLGTLGVGIDSAIVSGSESESDSGSESGSESE